MVRVGNLRTVTLDELVEEVDDLRSVKMGEMLEEVDGLSWEFLELRVFYPIGI